MKTQAYVFSWMGNFRSGLTVLLVLLFLLGSSWTSAQASEDIVVGDGTPVSCTQEALHQALTDVPAGGTITFDCEPAHVTIWGADIEIYKDLKIDGGNLVIFTGATGSGCAFCVLGDANVHFLNFTVDNAYSACDGVIYNTGTLTLHQITVSSFEGCDSIQVVP